METEQPKATNIESTTATVKITNTNVSADKPRNKENNEISERNNTATTREETATQQNKINANTNNRQGNKSAETKKNLKQTQIMTASKEAKETARNTSRKAEKNSTDSTNQRDDARTTERDTNTEQIAIDKNKNTETRVDKGTSSNKTSNETGEQAEGMEIEKPTKLFLSKPLYQKNKKTKFNLVNPDLKRKHETFYKCKLPRCTKESIMEGNQELVEHFHVLFRQIFKIDPTTIILPWNTDSHTPPLKKDSKLPETRELLDFYVDRTFVKCGYENWSRFYAAHDKLPEHMCEDTNWFRRQSMFFGADDIQVKRHTAAGWFLGSHPAMVCKDLKAAIQQHPAMKGLPVAIKFQNIRLEIEGKIPLRDQVRAAHIITDYHKVSEMRSAIRKIYDKPGALGYPLGIVMRFVPNIADSRYKGGSTVKANIKKLKKKQKNFLMNTTTHHSTAIQCIDYHLKDIGTLRGIVMGLETHDSTDKKPKNLFISIEEMKNSDRITFIYRREYEDQAASTICALPLILDAYYGARCGNWLCSHWQSECIGWVYDKASGSIRSKEDEYTAALLKNWEGDSDNEDQEQEQNVPVIFGHNTHHNQFDDNGTVLTMDSELSGWSSASNDEATVDKVAKRMKKLMEGNISEEEKQKLREILNGSSSSTDAGGQET